MMARLLSALVVLVAFCACNGLTTAQDDRTQAVSMAQAAYAFAKEHGVVFTNGPCIAERLERLPDWSVDVAHNPRQPVDDQPKNQCQAYRQGKTHHVVELDPQGNVIRTH